LELLVARQSVALVQRELVLEQVLVRQVEQLVLLQELHQEPLLAVAVLWQD